MSRVLSPQSITRYRANGCLHPLDGLTTEEVARFQSALAETESHLGGSLMAVDRKYRGNLHLLTRWVDEIVHHPKILDVIEDLLGTDILLYTSRFFIKEPRTDTIAAWHQDSTYFGLRPFDHVTAWLALSNVPLAAGPMEFAVGSHIRGQLLQKSNVVKNSVNTAGQIICEWFDQSQTEFGPLKPGQFSLHHTCTVHQSGPNNTDERRVGLALSYIPTRVRHVGSMRMPAVLVRGKDEFGHFDLLSRPSQDFGMAETRRHDASFKAYIDSFYEQLSLVEKEIPANAEALML